ncbi:MAG: hypothetical protein HY075_02945 [Deltaproteobacteria bacterium]|nr:hypothetical protein [Deltaproteobacteria bacterium]
MRVVGGARIVLGGACLALCAAACSLEPKTGASAFSVALRPSSALSAFDVLSGGPSILATPTSLGSLNCFGVSVSGPGVDGTAFCPGITAGVVDGTYSDINTQFKVSVPVGLGALTFEAYGSLSSSCTTLGSAYPDPLYFLGRVSADPTAATTVDVPVSFNASLSPFTCSGGSFNLFSDTFNYGLTSTSLPSCSSNWVTGGGSNLQTDSGSGNQLHMVQAGTGGMDFLNRTVDTSLAETALSLTVLSFSRPGATTVGVILGVANHTTSAPAAGQQMVGCRFLVGATTTDVAMDVGSGDATLVPSGAVGSQLGVSPPYRVVCHVKRTSTSSYTVQGELLNLSGTSLALSSVATVSSVCTGTNCSHAFIQGFASGAPDNIDFDNYSIDQTR